MQLRGVGFSEVNELVINAEKTMPDHAKEVCNRRAKNADPEEQ